MIRVPERACVTYQESLDLFEKMRAAGRLTQLDEDTIRKEVSEALTRNCSGRTTAASRRSGAGSGTP